MGGSQEGRRVALHLLTGLAVVGALLAAGPAFARTETLRWSFQYAGDIDGFRVLVGPRSGDYDDTIDVGLPRKNSAGAYVYDLQVPDDATVYVSVYAYRGSEQGPPSNERVRTPSSSGGGDTGGGDTGGGDTGGGDTGGGSGTFSLLLSPDGTNKNGVPLDGATIETDPIVYVAPESKIDRVEFYVDDSSLSGSPVRVENSPPFSLGGDSGASELDALPGIDAGPHQLSVRITTTSGGTQIVQASFERTGWSSSTPPRPPVLLP